MKFYRFVTERRRDFGKIATGFRYSCGIATAGFRRGPHRKVAVRFGCARISARSQRSCNATAIEARQDPSRLNSDKIYLDFDEIKDGVAAQFHPLLYGTLIISHRDFGYVFKPL